MALADSLSPIADDRRMGDDPSHPTKDLPMSSFTCYECCDTETIDRGGAEIACPYCTVTFRLSGLSHGLGNNWTKYDTAVEGSSSTMTFAGTPRSIRADAIRVLRDAEQEARANGKSGRSHYTSWAISIRKRVFQALNELA